MLPADDSATKNDVADGSILDAFLAHSESINDGLSLSLFSVEEKVQIDLAPANSQETAGAADSIRGDSEVGV